MDGGESTGSTELSELSEFNELNEISETFDGKVRKHLFDDSEKSDSDGHLRVYLRIKPKPNWESFSEYRVESGSSLAVKGKRYRFTQIFSDDDVDGNNSQEAVFNRVVRDDLAKLVDGQGFNCNCTIATYGASGSGKTHSLMGDETRPGIIPRTLEAVFNAIAVDRQPRFKPVDGEKYERLNAVQKENEIREIRQIVKNCSPGGFDPGIPPESQVDLSAYHRMSVVLQDQSANWKNFRKVHKKYDVWVSFVQIYNETLSDLLVSKDSSAMHRPPPALRLVLLNDNKTYIKGIKWVCVRNGTEAYAVLEKGRRNLRYARTNMNDKSSRSHCLFSMRIIQYDSDLNNVNMSTFRLCDLAGTERAKRTGNEGIRFDESRSINSSLHVLERCLMLLHKQQQGFTTKPPYRESKLTSLLRNALCGNEAISMLVTINPDPSAFAETQHTLHFSAIAQEIVIEPKLDILNKSRSCIDLTNDQFRESSIDTSHELHFLREEIKRMKFEFDIMMEKKERETRRELFDKFSEFRATRDKYHEEAISYEQERYDELQKWQEKMFVQYEITIKELEMENESLHKTNESLKKEMEKFKQNNSELYKDQMTIKEISMINSTTQNDLEMSILQSNLQDESNLFSNKSFEKSTEISQANSKTSEKSDDNYKSIILSIDKLNLYESFHNSHSNDSLNPSLSAVDLIFSKNVDDNPETTIHIENDIVHSETSCSSEATSSSRNISEKSIHDVVTESNVNSEVIKDNLNCVVLLDRIPEKYLDPNESTIKNHRPNVNTVDNESSFVVENVDEQMNNTSNTESIKMDNSKSKSSIGDTASDVEPIPKPRIVFSTPKNEKDDDSTKENVMQNKFYTEKKEKQIDDLTVNSGCLTVGASRRKLFTRRQNNEMAAEVKEPLRSLKHLNFDEESPGIIKPPKVEKPYQYETRSARRKKK